ncbi:hypothetical protein [Bacillus cereus]|uniref:hypothetical protein n=1 Tax=Bacillus cereus TaxID=1396 RepID=UPI0011557F08|nr:hypothetical protein [Bacillus cereus]
MVWSIYIAVCPELNLGKKPTIESIWQLAKYQIIALSSLLFLLFLFAIYLCFGWIPPLIITSLFLIIFIGEAILESHARRLRYEYHFKFCQQFAIHINNSITIGA